MVTMCLSWNAFGLQVTETPSRGPGLVQSADFSGPGPDPPSQIRWGLPSTLRVH